MFSTKAFVFRVALSIVQIALVGALYGQNISSIEAVDIAERFVRENGYTDAPDSVLKPQLDHESIELTQGRAALLKSRRNTLEPKAIGVKAIDDGWGVAFDYVDHPGTCRVVTVLKNGMPCRMKHQDGIRAYWLGFDER